MTDITIPPEALEAARVAWLESASDYNRLDESIRAACLALIQSWPGMWVGPFELGEGEMIILPLTESANAE